VEHQEAIETHAAEGYLLGDLTAAEHEAFELHFADCDTCFADVRDGATVVAAVRKENLVPVPVPVRGWQYKLVPTLAAAASIAVAVTTVGYQQVAVVAPLRAQLAKEREPRITPLYDLRESRAEEQAVAPDSRASFLFEFAIDPEVDSPPYTCKIVDARGKRHGPQLTVTAEQAHNPVDLLMPRETLVPGDYSLIVTGTGGVSVFEKRFMVR